MVVEGACLLGILIGLLGLHEKGFVGVLNEVRFVFSPPPPGGEMVLETSRKPQDKELPLGAYPPIARGVGVVVKGVCLLVVLIGRLGRHGTGLVGLLNEAQAAVEHEFGPPAVQCESQAPLGLLEEDGLARPAVDVEELEMPIGELRSDQVLNDSECA